MQVEHRETKSVGNKYKVDHPLVFEFKIKFVGHKYGVRSIALRFDTKDVFACGNETEKFSSYSEWIEDPESVVSEMS